MNIASPSFQFKGNLDKCKTIISPARVLYNAAITQANREGLAFVKRSKIYPDGSVITVVAQRHSNYDNWSGYIQISAVGRGIEITSVGSSPYVNLVLKTTSSYKPTTAIYSNTSISYKTKQPINTTSQFKKRFGGLSTTQLTQDIFISEERITPPVLPYTEYTCISKNYSDTSEIINFTGIQDLRGRYFNSVASSPSLSFITYQEYKFSTSYNEFIYDARVKGNSLYALSGTSSNGSSFRFCIFNISSSSKTSINTNYVVVGEIYTYPTSIYIKIGDNEYTKDMNTTGIVTGKSIRISDIKLSIDCDEISIIADYYGFKTATDEGTLKCHNILDIRVPIRIDKDLGNPDFLYYVADEPIVESFNNQSAIIKIETDNTGITLTENRYYPPLTVNSSWLMYFLDRDGFYIVSPSNMYFDETEYLTAHTQLTITHPYLGHIISDGATYSYTNPVNNWRSVYTYTLKPYRTLAGYIADYTAFPAIVYGVNTKIYNEFDVLTYETNVDAVFYGFPGSFNPFINRQQGTSYLRYKIDPASKHFIVGINYISDTTSPRYKERDYVYFGIKATDNKDILEIKKVANTIYYGDQQFFDGYPVPSDKKLNAVQKYIDRFGSESTIEVTIPNGKDGKIIPGVYSGKTFEEAVLLSAEDIYYYVDTPADFKQSNKVTYKAYPTQRYIDVDKIYRRIENKKYTLTDILDKPILSEGLISSPNHTPSSYYPEDNTGMHLYANEYRWYEPIDGPLTVSLLGEPLKRVSENKINKEHRHYIHAIYDNSNGTTKVVDKEITEDFSSPKDYAPSGSTPFSDIPTSVFNIPRTVSTTFINVGGNFDADTSLKFRSSPTHNTIIYSSKKLSKLNQTTFSKHNKKRNTIAIQSQSDNTTNIITSIPTASGIIQLNTVGTSLLYLGLAH